MASNIQGFVLMVGLSLLLVTADEFTVDFELIVDEGSHNVIGTAEVNRLDPQNSYFKISATEDNVKYVYILRNNGESEVTYTTNGQEDKQTFENPFFAKYIARPLTLDGWITAIKESLTSEANGDVDFKVVKKGSTDTVDIWEISLDEDKVVMETANQPTMHSAVLKMTDELQTLIFKNYNFGAQAQQQPQQPQEQQQGEAKKKSWSLGEIIK